MERGEQFIEGEFSEDELVATSGYTTTIGVFEGGWESYQKKAAYFGVLFFPYSIEIAQAATYACAKAVVPDDLRYSIKDFKCQPRDMERNLQSHLLKDIGGNPFRPISINPNWLTPTVTSLATIAYEERILPSGEIDTVRLSILADALEDSGCDNADILTHLRSPGVHVRGCWAVDKLLGKE